MPVSMLWGAVFNANRGLTTPKSWLPKPFHVSRSSNVGPGHCMWLAWNLFQLAAVTSFRRALRRTLATHRVQTLQGLLLPIVHE